MDPTGNQVVLGYADGVVRLFALETENDTKSTGSSMYKLTKALSARYLFFLNIFPDFLKYLCYLSSPGEYFLLLVPYQYLCMYLRQYWLNVYFWRLFQKKVYKCQWFFSWRYTPNMWHVLYRIHVMKLYPKHDQILRHYICTPNSIETKLIACEIGFLPKIWKPMIFSFLQIVPASYFRFSLWFFIQIWPALILNIFFGA